MTYKGHIAVGFSMNIPVFAYLIKNNFVVPNEFNYAVFFGITVFFSLLPDLDTPNSFIANKNPVFKIIGYLFSVIDKHRGVTHSIFFVLLTMYALYLLFAPENIWISVIAGGAYLSHLIADAMTKEGVAFLYPLIKKRFRILPSFLAFRTGGFIELLVAGAFYIATFLETNYFFNI